MAKNICGIVVSEMRSAEEAKKTVESIRNCPLLFVSGTNSKTIYSVYIVPEEKRWWLKYPETNPEVNNSERVQVYIIENLLIADKVNSQSSEKKTEIAPCGANCQTCQLRTRYNCSGCPATIHFNEKTT